MPQRQDQAAYFFHQGTSDSAYRYLGCHMTTENGSYIYTFRTWAPRAVSVFLVSDKTGWEYGKPFARITHHGVWECVLVSDVSLEGMPYKFRINAANGIRLKGDPYAFCSRGGADGASVVCHPSAFLWQDKAYLQHRKQATGQKGKHFLSSPLNIYEVHAASFDRRDDGSCLTYREMADKLVPYLKYMGYTHVAFMPLAEQACEASCTDQICGFYAPASRYGMPDDLRYLINACHAVGIGVIMDWALGCFAKDEWGLYEFDGTPLYEYQGKDRMESLSGKTRFFDLGREEIQSFLISNAVYWMREFHVDGLRALDVASVLYLDYDRADGQWMPNTYGDNRNLEAIAFLNKLNNAVDREFPDVLMIAQESSEWKGVTAPTSQGGLGFDLKWNTGWANGLSAYLQQDPVFRSHHHRALHFPMLYAYAEQYVLPISHGEAVHGKPSLPATIAAEYEDKFRTMRAALMFQMAHPGKKMLFMGTEFGQFAEWNAEKNLEWFMLDYAHHYHLREFVRALNRFYVATPALWERDFDPTGFSWILSDDAARNLIAFSRHDSRGEELIAVISFSGSSQQLNLPVSQQGDYEVVFDSCGSFSGRVQSTVAEQEQNILVLDLPPYTSLYLRSVINTIQL